MSKFPKLLWKATTTNRKTGNIPSAWVGETREESIKSCEGCPLLAKKVCYSQNGAVKMGHISLIKSRDKKSDSRQSKEYSFDFAVEHRAWNAKAVRLTSIGDAARCDQNEVAEAESKARALGLAWLSYTHFAGEVEDKFKYLYTASSGKGNDLEEDIKGARALLKDGWNRVTAVVPWNTFELKTPKDSMICPAIKAHSKGTRITCNDCRLCDPAAKGPKIILFPRHSNKDKKSIRARALEGASYAINLLVKL